MTTDWNIYVFPNERHQRQLFAGSHHAATICAPPESDDMDVVKRAKHRMEFEETCNRIIVCLRLCADFTQQELVAFDGPTFKSAIGRAFLAAASDSASDEKVED